MRLSCVSDEWRWAMHAYLIIVGMLFLAAAGRLFALAILGARCLLARRAP
jgi:hypothetical protein